jgi:hypothetical protein
VSIRELISEVVTYGVVVCFNLAEVCADACVAAGFEGVCDEKACHGGCCVCKRKGSLGILV